MLYYILLFAVFVGIRYIVNYFLHDLYLSYIITVIITGFLIMFYKSKFPELKFKFDLQAVLIGMAVFLLWVLLEGRYPWIPFLGTPGEGLNPLTLPKVLIIPAMIFRLLGSILVAPIVEELFFRSFLYRFIATKNWKKMPIGRYDHIAFFVTIFFFGFIHMRWLPGLLAGAAFTGMMVWRKNLSSPILAHLTANLCLCIYVLSTQSWTFW